MIEIKFSYNTSLAEELASVVSSIYLHKINLTYSDLALEKSNLNALIARIQKDFKENSLVMLELERDNYLLGCKAMEGEDGLVLSFSPNNKVIIASEKLDLRPYIRIALDVSTRVEILEMKVIG